MQDRRVRLERVVRVDDRGQLLVRDLNELGCFGGLAPGLGDDERDRLAVETNALDREDRVVENDMPVIRGEARSEKVLARDDAEDAGAR